MRLAAMRAVPALNHIVTFLCVGTCLAACHTLDAVTAAPGALFFVGGLVTGTTGPLTLACGGTSQSVAGDGNFTCERLFASADAFDVSVLTPPTGEVCIVSDGNGTIGHANVSAVVVVCGASLGDITGLPASPLPSPTVTSTPAPSPSSSAMPPPMPSPSPSSMPVPMTPLLAHVTGSVAGASLVIQVDGQSVTLAGDGNTLLLQDAPGTAYTVSLVSAGPAMACGLSGATNGVVGGTLGYAATYALLTCRYAINVNAYAQAANVVGQMDFVSAMPSASASGLHSPRDVAGTSGGGYFYISDTANNRVVGVTLPFVNGPTYAFTMGSLASVSAPRGVSAAAMQLALVDSTNNRVLLYAGNPNTDRAASVVVGGTLGYCSPAAMTRPSAAILLLNKLFVADTNNHRILIWNSVPNTNSDPADMVLGQIDGYNCSRRTTSLSAMNNPQDVWSDGNTVVVADTGNNRVLVWNNPTMNNQNADAVIGQASGTTAARPQPATAVALNAPAGVVSDGSSIFVCDTGNHRVTAYPLTGAAYSRSAVSYFGQASPSDSSVNAGNGPMPTRRSLSSPTGIGFVNTSLAVVDSGNNRVLLFNSN